MVRAGSVFPGYDETPVVRHMQGREIGIAVDLDLGNGKARVFTCDLTLHRHQRQLPELISIRPDRDRACGTARDGDRRTALISDPSRCLFCSLSPTAPSLRARSRHYGTWSCTGGPGSAAVPDRITR
jgi:hypothetical protein